MCGYVWGKKNERVEAPIVNEKERQTYLGEGKYCDGSMSDPGIPKGKWRTYYSIFKISCRAFKLHIRGGRDAHPTRVLLFFDIQFKSRTAYLMSQYNNKRRSLIWDGAKYHFSAEVKDF